MASQNSLNKGRYVICPLECKIIGNAEGCERVRASIHTHFTTFGIITLVVNHLDSHLKYNDLFATSCGSIGEFTNIQKLQAGYAMSRQMKHYNFPIRNFDGTFYAQVHPFDPEHILIQSPFLKRPVLFLSDIPKYWLKDVLCACMTLIDGDLQTQLNGCVHVVSILCPITRLKLISEIWCTMDLRTRHLTTLQPLPNLGALRSTLAVGRPTIRHLDSKLLPMSRRLNRESAPMFRRLNRECPCEARGFCLRTNFHSSATTFAVMIQLMRFGQ